MDSLEKTILVVEDEMPLLEAIKAKLTRGGFEVVTARSVEQAMNHLEDIRKIDAIWLDHYLLGKESGLDFLMKCKLEKTWCRTIPIFVVSNTASPDKVRAYLKFGVSRYYVKAEKRLDEMIQEIKSEISRHEAEEREG